MIVYILISLLTIFRSVLVCTAFIKDPYRQLCTRQNYYIISLGISDLLMGNSTYWHSLERQRNCVYRSLPLCYYLRSVLLVKHGCTVD